MNNIKNITICNPKIMVSSDDKILKKMLCDFKNDFKNNLSNITNQIDSQIAENTDYLQIQINDLNKKYLDIQKFINNNNDRYINIINELNNIYDITATNTIKINECCDCSCNECIDVMPASYDDPSKITKLVYNCDTPKTIHITLVGGGGAGGIGFVDGSYYCSGGGGGAGACIIQYPVKLIKGTELTIVVGKGGCATGNQCATDSYVVINYPDGTSETITAKHGKNGVSCSKLEEKSQDIIQEIIQQEQKENSSYDELLEYVKGGTGGTSITSVLNGNNGQDGRIAIPSFVVSVGGTGGASILYQGGVGGSNMFGQGGAAGTVDNLLGLNGKHGSGGGGSASLLSNSIIGNKYSGDGGNGIVIIN